MLLPASQPSKLKMPLPCLWSNTKSIDPVIVAREKAPAVKKNGILEMIDTKETLESIGGLDVLKEWLLKRRHAFSQTCHRLRPANTQGPADHWHPRNRQESLTAKATAKVFGVPLLKLDAGRIFAGLVGQSESNLRAVIQTAEAIAPCCLWIDEVEKGFAGSKSSGQTDGGTSSQGLWLLHLVDAGEKAPVFVVATANDVSQLPPEMLRKGRFDELMFVDLPNQQEREAIWEIQIAKYGRDPRSMTWCNWPGQRKELPAVKSRMRSSKPFTWRLTLAMALGKREPTDLDIAGVLTEFVPLSKLMAEQITGLRNWAKGRARLATSPGVERGLRKIL